MNPDFYLRTISAVCVLGIILSGCVNALPLTEVADIPGVTESVSTATATPLATGSTEAPTQQEITLTLQKTPTPTPLDCWNSGGRIETGNLRTNLLPLGLDYRIYIPPCYEQEPNRRYPVIYLVHGQSYKDDQWDRLGIDELADELIPTGEIPAVIIVMPRDRVWTQPSEDNFGRAVVEVLVPFVDSQYRSLPAPKYRVIGGLSRGASWAVHLGLTQWEIFGAIGAHSLPVFWEDVAFIRDWFEVIPENQMPRIYIDVGEGDLQIIRNSAEWFGKLLNQHGIPHEWHLFAGRHTEEYWSAHLESYLRWYTMEW